MKLVGHELTLFRPWFNL